MPLIPNKPYQQWLTEQQASVTNPFAGFGAPPPIVSPYNPNGDFRVQPPQPQPQRQRPAQPNYQIGAPVSDANYVGPPIASTQQRDVSSSAYGQNVAVNGQMPGNEFQDVDAARAYYPGAGVQRQPQGGEKATGDTAQGGTEGALGLGFSNMDWVRLGGSLLAGSQNGGDWGKPTEALGQIANEKENKKRYDTEQKRQAELDAMNKEMFGFQLGDAKYNAAERERLRVVQGEQVKALEGTNPQLAAAIKSMSPEGFGAFYGQRLIAEEQTKAQIEATRAQNVFTAGENAKDRAAQLSVADLRRTDPTATVRGRADMARITPWSEAANTATVYTLPRIQRMREIMDQLAVKNGVNQPLDANSRVTLAQWGLADKEAQGLMQEFSDLQRGFVLEEAQKLKPASNLDVEMIQKTLVGPNTEIAAAQRMFNNMESELNRGVAYYNNMVDWMDQGYSLDGKNAKGQTLNQAYGPVPTSSSTKVSGGSLPAPGSSGPPPQNAIILLKQNPTPEKRAQFDEIFGRGAADLALATAKSASMGLKSVNDR